MRTTSDRIGIGCLVLFGVFIAWLVIGGIMSADRRAPSTSTAPGPTFGSQLEMCVEMQRKTGSLDAGCQEVDRKLGEVFKGATRESQQDIRKRYGQ